MNPYSDLDIHVRRLHELERCDCATDLVNGVHKTDVPPRAHPGAKLVAHLVTIAWTFSGMRVRLGYWLSPTDSACGATPQGAGQAKPTAECC
jgi:hypothetical protein